MSVRELLIIGAGPSGLAAAIAARQRGLDYLVVEKGILVNSIYRFPPQMVFFTTPELLEVGGLPLVTPYDKPTRAEALKYYRRVADTFDLQISFDEAVLAVRPDPPEGPGDPDNAAGDAFEVDTRSSHGVQRVRRAKYVIFAIGYYDHPVRIGVPGEDLPHVDHYYHEPYLHYRQRVVIVGGGNSAAEAALELFRSGAHVTLVHRSPALKSTVKYWVRPDIENRLKAGSIAARFSHRVVEIRPKSVVIAPVAPGDPRGPGGSGQGPGNNVDNVLEEIPADAVYLLTGYRADNDLMCRAGIRFNDRDAPVHDRATFETNVKNIFVAGGALAGVDTGTIFIENGRFHGEKIVEEIGRRLRSSES